MAASNLSDKHDENIYQTRTRNQFQHFNNESPAEPFQQFNPPPYAVGGITSSANRQSSSCTEFLNRINFSVPPPFVTPASNSTAIAHQVPPPFGFSPSTSVFPSAILPNYYVSKEKYPLNIRVENESLQCENILPNVKMNISRPKIKIHVVSNQLKNYFFMLKNMKGDLENSNSMYNQLDDESWCAVVTKLSSQREVLQKLKQQIEIDPTSLTSLKYKIKKRQRKRKAGKKKGTAEKPFSKYEVAQLHRHQLQRTADAKKQEQKFKLEADSILYAVRQKKSEASSQMQYLNALFKLYGARVQALHGQNKYVSNDSIIGFNKILDKLKSMWDHQMKEYVTEENGLKIMLKDAAATAENEDHIIRKKHFGQWLKLMFGTTDLQKNVHYSTYDELTEIRYGWDKYVVFDESNSSKIPPGWAIPKPCCDNVWSKFVS